MSTGFAAEANGGGTALGVHDQCNQSIGNNVSGGTRLPLDNGNALRLSNSDSDLYRNNKIRLEIVLFGNKNSFFKRFQYIPDLRES